MLKYATYYLKSQILAYGTDRKLRFNEPGLWRPTMCVVLGDNTMNISGACAVKELVRRAVQGRDVRTAMYRGGASLGRPVSVPGKTCHLKQDLNDSWHFKR